MQLIVMRHGEAGHHPVDTQRALTGRGLAAVQETMRELQARGVNPSRVWSSPYLRARQTADVVSEMSGVPVEHHNTLIPDGDPDALRESLETIASEPSVMLVSHMPFVNALTGLFLEGRLGGYPYDTAQARILDMEYPGWSGAILRADVLGGA